MMFFPEVPSARGSAANFVLREFLQNSVDSMLVDVAEK